MSEDVVVAHTHETDAAPLASNQQQHTEETAESQQLQLEPAPAPPVLPSGQPTEAQESTADGPQTHHKSLDEQVHLQAPATPVVSKLPLQGSAVITDTPAPLPQQQNIPPKIPKPKQVVYSYHHTDSGPTADELEEFFSYTEIPGLVNDGKNAFMRGWGAIPAGSDWPNAPKNIKQSFILGLLEQLEHRDAEVRFEAARRLTYIAEGTPMYSTSPDEQLQFILQNCSLLRDCGALTSVYDALRSAGGRWSIVSDSTLADEPSVPPDWPSLEERQEFLEELNSEIALYLQILYFMVEIFKGDDDWADELMTLAPPLPTYAFILIANLREKNAKGYPVKKLLLLLWKTMLSCFGGQKDISRVKKLVRDIEGLPPDFENRKAKLQPAELANFRHEVLAKYPTFNVPDVARPISEISLDQIAAAAAPEPLRPLYPYAQEGQPRQTGPNGTGPAAPPPPPPMPPTPAPTPPQSPQQKPKKQQFQTDQSRPFVLPFAQHTFTSQKKANNVPRSIDEAGRLFMANFRISTELWQTVKLREECIADESGTSQAEADLVRHAKATSRVSSLADRMAKLRLEREEGDDASPDSLEMLYQLESSINKQARHEEDVKKANKLKERAVDVKRLQRVELFYRATLPHMQCAVIVLLKLLLATVAPNTLASNMLNSDDDESPPRLTTEATDIMRHREITSKSVSAVVILLLRWLKVSHVMKFQYLSQLLVDSNCLLLILKIFGLHEATVQVRAKHEVPDLEFCYLCGSNAPDQMDPQDVVQNAMPSSSVIPDQSKSSTETKTEDEVEIINDFSARNFFSFINFVHILQKLSKRKVHRTLLMVQYKSSAILKRLLKVSQPLLQLYTLKIIKSQIPFCGRKWRQSNMKVITAVYLNCRPDLRDDWLTTTDMDGDVEDALPSEQALRLLVTFFNKKHYRVFAPSLHRRSSSREQVSHSEQQYSGQPLPSPSSNPTSSADDAFPPVRSSSFGLDCAQRPSYIPDMLMDAHYFTDDYEQLLGDLLTPRYSVDANGVPSLYPDGSGEQTQSAWSRLGEFFGDNSDDISDSESVGSIGQLNFDDTASESDLLAFDGDEARLETRPGWSEMSPDIILALEEERDNAIHGSPRSPRPRRSSSETKSPALRPVLASVDADDDVLYDDDVFDERGPAESAPHSGPAVDEVEAVFGE